MESFIHQFSRDKGPQHRFASTEDPIGCKKRDAKAFQKMSEDKASRMNITTPVICSDAGGAAGVEGGEEGETECGGDGVGGDISGEAGGCADGVHPDFEEAHQPESDNDGHSSDGTRSDSESLLCGLKRARQDEMLGQIAEDKVLKQARAIAKVQNGELQSDVVLICRGGNPGLAFKCANHHEFKISVARL